MFSLAGLSLGILCSTHFSYTVTYLGNLSCLISALITSGIIRKTLTLNYTRIIINSSLMLIIGMSYTNLRHNYYLNQLIPYKIPRIKVSGYVSGIPKTYLNYQSVEFKINSNPLNSSTILVNYPLTQKLIPGDFYRLQLNLSPLKLSPTKDSYQSYLEEHAISAQGNLIEQAQPIKNNFSLNALINKTRYNLINYLTKTLTNQEYQGLSIALITGYTNLIPEEQFKMFKNSGIIHIISISGLHIAIITLVGIYLVQLILNFTPLTKTPKPIVLASSGAIIAITYSLIAGFSIPTQRSLYLILISCYVLNLRIYLSLLHKLMLSLSMVLIIDPLASSNSGFWFSFGLVGIIFWLQNTKNSAKLFLWFKLQLALALFSLVLSLYFYNSYPIIASLANLWAIPVLGNLLTPLLVVSGLLHLDWLLKFSTQLCGYLMFPIKYLSQIPLYTQVTPDLASISLYFIGFSLLLMPQIFKLQKLMGISLLISIFFPITSNLELNRAKIYLFEYKNYGFSLIETQNNYILVGIGSDKKAQASSFKYNLLPFLTRHQIRTINYIFLDDLKPELINLFKEDHITIMEPNPQQVINCDLLEFTLKPHSLKLTTLNHNTYLGNGENSFPNTSWQNIVILSPEVNLNWVFSTQATKLFINPNSGFNSNYLTENINLDLDPTLLNQTGNMVLDLAGD